MATQFSGRIFSVDVDKIRLPGGREVTMEVVRHPASVVLVPMPDPDHVVLVRQYRYAIDRWVWELPAGTVNSDEDVDAAAWRECHEEIGKVPRRLERFASLFPTPGYCDEEMVFFRIDGLDEPTSAAHLDEDEQLEPRTFALSEVRAMVQRGEIVDMKTVAGLAMLEATGSQPLAALLVGNWSLVSFEAVSGDHTEYPFGPDAVGSLTYDGTGHMDVQIMKKGRPFLASDDQEDGTIEEVSAAFKSYAAYYGTYSVDEPARVITHHVAASMFPNWAGTDQRREAVVEGNRLILSTRLTRRDGNEWLFRVVWERRE